MLRYQFQMMLLTLAKKCMIQGMLIRYGLCLSPEFSISFKLIKLGFYMLALPLNIDVKIFYF